MTNKPFVSVVIPTRNRSHLLRHTVNSLKIQTFKDFEVIVCDNSDSEGEDAAENKQLIENLADSRFHYIRPEKYLNMPDNWEFAYQTAKGEYIAYLSDRSVLYPSTLWHLHTAASSNAFDIINWGEDIYIPIDEYGKSCKGYIQESGIMPEKAKRYNPRQQLQRCYRINLGEYAERRCFFRGKICFGAYSKELINTIKSHIGRVFWPLSCDYTSRFLALYFAETAIDLGIRLSMQIDTDLSNGKRCGRDPNYNLKIIKELDPSFSLQQAPLQGLYYSGFNTFYTDYLNMKNRFFPAADDVVLNLKAIILIAQEELKSREGEIPEDQQNILKNYLSKITYLDKFWWSIRKKIKSYEFSVLLKKLSFTDFVIKILRNLLKISKLSKYNFFFNAWLENKHKEYTSYRKYSLSLISRRYFDSIEEAIYAADSQNNELNYANIKKVEVK